MPFFDPVSLGASAGFNLAGSALGIPSGFDALRAAPGIIASTPQGPVFPALAGDPRAGGDPFFGLSGPPPGFRLPDPTPFTFAQRSRADPFPGLAGNIRGAASAGGTQPISAQGLGQGIAQQMAARRATRTAGAPGAGQQLQQHMAQSQDFFDRLQSAVETGQLPFWYAHELAARMPVPAGMRLHASPGTAGFRFVDMPQLAQTPEQLAQIAQRREISAAMPRRNEFGERLRGPERRAFRQGFGL